MTEQEWLNIFGDNLNGMLCDARMSQRELADAAMISEAAISSYIHKRKLPSVKAIINIAYALDCSVYDLIDFGDIIR